jgi:hypothetical protein
MAARPAEEFWLDWRESLAGATTLAEGIRRMQTETLQLMAPHLRAATAGADPIGWRRLLRVVQAELAYRIGRDRSPGA